MKKKIPDKILLSKPEKKMADLEKADEELRNLEETYRLSFEQVSDVIFILDTNLRILSMSPSVETNLGYHPVEFIGKPFARIKNVMDPGCFAQASIKLASILEGKTVDPSDYIIFAKDGALRYIETNATPVVKNGRLFCIVCVTRDITRRKRMEESLLSERNFSQTIVESMPGLFFVLDEQGKFLHWNDHLKIMTEYSDTEIRERLFTDIRPESQKGAVMEHIREIFRLGEFSWEAEMIFKDGTRKIFRLHAKRMYYEGQACIVGTGMDITDQKRAENDLKRFAENLQDANIALRVLMQQRNEDQKDIEEKLQANVNDLVIPYLKKLKQANLDDRNKNYLNVLESNLRDVLSPYMRDFLSSHKNLTPQEIQIVDLIMKGKHTKEIADMLNVSVSTIASHRNNIRKKMNLRNSKINLRSHVLSIG